MKNYYKIIIIGDIYVGKSSIFNRLTDYSKSEYISTIGIDFIKKEKFNGTTDTLMVWDASGQERFHTLLRSYYRGVHGVILVFDVSVRDTFSNVKYWLKELDAYSHLMISVILIGNKIDLERKVSENEAFELAQLYNISYLETSVKLNYNIIDIYTILCKKINYRQWFKYKEKVKHYSETEDANCFCIG